MGKMLLGIITNGKKEKVFLDADAVYDVESGQTVASVIKRVKTLEEAVELFLKGPAVEGHMDRLSELVAQIEKNRKQIATLSASGGSLPPAGYEIDGAKVVPITLVPEGVNVPEGAAFAVQLEEIDI